MDKYEFDFIDQEAVRPEPGTNQIPELKKLLNTLGKQGWRPVHTSGNLEAEFQMLLFRVKP